MGTSGIQHAEISCMSSLGHQLMSQQRHASMPDGRRRPIAQSAAPSAFGSLMLILQSDHLTVKTPHRPSRLRGLRGLSAICFPASMGKTLLAIAAQPWLRQALTVSDPLMMKVSASTELNVNGQPFPYQPNLHNLYQHLQHQTKLPMVVRAKKSLPNNRQRCTRSFAPPDHFPSQPHC